MYYLYFLVCLFANIVVLSSFCLNVVHGYAIKWVEIGNNICLNGMHNSENELCTLNCIMLIINCINQGLRVHKMKKKMVFLLLSFIVIFRSKCSPLYHGSSQWGEFIKPPNKYYVSRKVDYFYDCNPNKWSLEASFKAGILIVLGGTF